MEHRGRVFRFADVEVREGEFSVIKAGEVLPVEPKAYKVLEFLVRNPGRAIPKDEILDAVWNDCEVSESSLTRSIAILRRLLGDDIHEQRFIATVATVGYRFVHPVAVSEEPPADAAESVPRSTGPETPPLTPLAKPRSRWWWWRSVAAAVGVVAAALIFWRSSRVQPVVDAVTQLTDDGNPKLVYYPLVSDGSRIYFGELRGSSEVLAQVAATGGQTGTLASGIESPRLGDLAPDSSSLLLANAQKQNWFLLPLPAGEPRSLPGFDGIGNASFSLGGNFFLSKGRSLYVGDKDGSATHKLSDFPRNVESMVGSPDGKRIRVDVWSNVTRRSLWEVSSEGSGAHPLLPGWQSDADTCCGRWTADGRYFVFRSRLHGRSDLWALPQGRGWLQRASSPLRLTSGPLSYQNPFPSRDGKHLYAFGLKERGELVRYDSKSRQFLPYLSGISAMDATVSSDGKWIAYMSYPDHNLWSVRADGSERLQLTYPPMFVYYPRISPDGTMVAYGDGNTTAVYVVPIRGGIPRKIYDKGYGALWSPDGNSVVISFDDSTNQGLGELETMDLQTGKASSVPDSAGKAGAFWPSRDMLVAFTNLNGVPSLVTFDFKSKKWSHLVSGLIMHWMQSVDGKYLYYTTGGDDPRIWRVRFSDGKVEEIASLKNFRPVVDERAGSWVGVTAEGDPLLTRNIGTQEIYDLSVRWP
jgi:DNA-binding winged helix-turn-helix (wHTH) protein/Tol biopolymer transport system component